MWLGEPQADSNLAPDVAGKWLFKTRIGIRVPFLQAIGCFLRSHTWFVYIQFLITIKTGSHSRIKSSELTAANT